MTRFKAAVIHLFLSALALVLLSLATIYYWYPDPFFRYANVIDILKLLALVDVILGPILTFVVFKPGKPSLKFDLTVIIATQIAAFAYGSYHIQAAHPEFLTYVDGVMHAVPDSVIDERLIEDEKLSAFYHVGPKLAVAVLPPDMNEVRAFMADAIPKGKALYQYPKYYQSFPPSMDVISSRALDIQAIAKVPEYKSLIDAFSREKGIDLKEVYFLKLVTFRKDSIVVLDKQTAQLIGFLNINPG